jgi:hypothetical protein
MCMKPARSEAERLTARAPESTRHSRPQPWRNTRPRGNPEPDRRDVERSVERLEMLLGR